MPAGILAGEIRLVRVREAGRIVVASPVANAEHRPLGQGHARQLGVFGDVAEQALGGGLDAQGLLDKILDLGRVGAQGRFHRRVAEQQPQAVSNGEGGGLVAANQQVVGDADDLSVGELAALAGLDVLHFDLQQVAQDVVAWLPALVLHRLKDVVLQFNVLFHRVKFLCKRQAPGKRQHPSGGPHFELRQVHAREAEQLGDDDHRQRFGEGLHEFDLALIDPSVDEFIDDAAHEGLTPTNLGGAELGVHQGAIVAVHGQVFAQRRVTGPALPVVQRPGFRELDQRLHVLDVRPPGE